MKHRHIGPLDGTLRVQVQERKADETHDPLRLNFRSPTPLYFGQANDLGRGMSAMTQNTKASERPRGGCKEKGSLSDAAGTRHPPKALMKL